MSVRSRFAPSPTGYLHIGGVRTALYSWLFARKHGGQFILRIEDTDKERSTEESVNAILDGMKWLNLNYDEGPFYQTKRFDRYQEVTDQLLNEGKAYRCYCSKERLEKLRETQQANKEKPRYDGRCRHNTQSQEGSFVIRFKNPETGSVVFDDFIRGRIEVQNSELDDLIIARSDGTPTYNFTVVVDDWDMEITHIIRGDDHINNTPRQINILNALGATVPQYGHVPMILGEDGKRLSKRHGAVSVLQYRDDGFLPQALLNYLVRLGWSYGDQEVFSRAEMIEFFDPKKVSKSPAIFNTDKLLWLNQQYIKTLPVGDVAEQLAWHMQQADISTLQGPALTEVVKALRERAKTLKEMAESSRCFYEDIGLDEKAAQQNLKPAVIDALSRIQQGLERLDNWQADSIHNVLTATAEMLDLKMGKVAQPVRVAVTGGTVSPPLGITLELIGRERTLSRIGKALAYCQARVETE